MSLLQSNQARYFFETAALSPDTLQVADFSGHEAVSQMFRFDLNLVSDDPEINFADVIKKSATLTMRRDGEPVKIHGLVADFEQGGYTADWVAYRAALVPRLWLLSLNYQSRVFQNVTVQDIVTQVLKEAGFTAEDFRFALSGNYKPREYCVQYRETDLNARPLSQRFERRIICSCRFRTLARRGRASPYGWAKPARRRIATNLPAFRRRRNIARRVSCRSRAFRES
jgi:uncharacterized protein involved in type VI secretion and phage assembly